MENLYELSVTAGVPAIVVLFSAGLFGAWRFSIRMTRWMGSVEHRMDVLGKELRGANERLDEHERKCEENRNRVWSAITELKTGVAKLCGKLGDGK